MARRRLILGTLVCMAVLIAAVGQAAVTSATLTFTPADSSKAFNAGVVITLTANWTGGTPPFAASFKSGANGIGNLNTSQQTAAANIVGATLAEGAHQFSVDILETSVVNATPTNVMATRQITIDKTAPTVTVNITEGSLVSPNAGFNRVRFNVSSNKRMPVAPTVQIMPGSGWSFSPVGTPAYPTNSVEYTMTVPAGTPSGQYTIRALCVDDTEPVATRNQGTGQSAFNVNATVTGTPVVNTTTPQSPTRSSSVTVTGTTPIDAAAQRVVVAVDGVAQATATVAAGATAWTVGLSNLSAGTHTITAQRIDSLGNMSGFGAPLALVVDQTPPAVPSLNSIKTPTNQATIKVTGVGALDPAPTSTPVRVVITRGGIPLASTTAGNDGTFTFDAVPLVTGANLLMVLAADGTWDVGGNRTGNVSALSSPLIVELDQTPPVVVGGGIVISGGGRNRAAPILAAHRDGVNGGAGMRASTGIADRSFASPAIARRGVPPTGTSQRYAQCGFEPPMPGSAHDRTVFFARAALAGGWHGEATVTLVGASLSAPTGAAWSVPMSPCKTSTTDGWQALWPRSRGDGRYRFSIVDATGRKVIWPADRWFIHRVDRSDTLVITRAAPAATTDKYDVWPVGPLGLPTPARVVAYRRVFIDSDLEPALVAMLAQSARGIGPTVIGMTPGTHPALDSGSLAGEMQLLRTGRLPPARLDLLLRDVVEGRLAPDGLPDDATLSQQEGGDALRSAIRFQRMHAPKP